MFSDPDRVKPNLGPFIHESAFLLRRFMFQSNSVMCIEMENVANWLVRSTNMCLWVVAQTFLSQINELQRVSPSNFTFYLCSIHHNKNDLIKGNSQDISQWISSRPLHTTTTVRLFLTLFHFIPNAHRNIAFWGGGSILHRLLYRFKKSHHQPIRRWTDLDLRLTGGSDPVWNFFGSCSAEVFLF
jgi:hypothetical protein